MDDVWLDVKKTLDNIWNQYKCCDLDTKLYPIVDFVMAKLGEEAMKYSNGMEDKIDNAKCRYPHAIVWTPIPIIS